jgi:hypothetical protein
MIDLGDPMVGEYVSCLIGDSTVSEYSAGDKDEEGLRKFECDETTPVLRGLLAELRGTFDKMSGVDTSPPKLSECPNVGVDTVLGSFSSLDRFPSPQLSATL